MPVPCITHRARRRICKLTRLFCTRHRRVQVVFSFVLRARYEMSSTDITLFGTRLASALAGCPSLEYLNLDGNQLSDSISLLAPGESSSSLCQHVWLQEQLAST